MNKYSMLAYILPNSGDIYTQYFTEIWKKRGRKSHDSNDGNKKKSHVLSRIASDILRPRKRYFDDFEK